MGIIDLNSRCKIEGARVLPWGTIREGLRHVDLNLNGNSRKRDVHSIHPYPAKFTAELPGTLIDAIALPSATIVDPFCGSGTTLVEALRRGHAAAGFDANPVALLISRAKIFRLVERDKFSFEKLHGKAVPGVSLPSAEGNIKVMARNNGLERFWFPPYVFSELLYLKHLGADNLTPDQQLIWNVALSSIVVRVSHQDEETRYSWVDKKVQPWDTFKIFKGKLRDVINACWAASKEYASSGTTGATVAYADYSSRSFWIGEAIYDCAVFSPPYPNTFDYHLYHRLRLLLFGEDPAKLRRSEIGAHLKYEADTKQYLASMKSALEALFRSLKPTGVVAMVVGDSIIQGNSYDNAADLTQIAKEIGFHIIGSYQRDIPPERKSFSRAAERLHHEQVIVFGKPPEVVLASEKLISHKVPKNILGPIQLELSPMPEVEPFYTGYKLQPLEASLAQEFYSSASKCPERWPLLRLGPFFNKVSLPGGQMENIGPTLQSLIDNGGKSISKCTTYFGHGLHSYVGKFYPQIVRQLLLLDVADKDYDFANHVVVDPFCGSGTTLVESCIVGFGSIGVELNPVGVMISTAKIELLRQGFETVRRRGESLLRRLQSLQIEQACSIWHSSERRAHLQSWFPSRQLSEIAAIYALLRETFGEPFSKGAPFFVLLSSLIRQCSLQKPSDLRIRRRPENEVIVSPIASFRSKLTGLLVDLERWQEIVRKVPLGLEEAAWKSRVIMDDTRHALVDGWKELAENTATIITSPPYAAALPYIDTDRLSIEVLELDQIRGGQRELERTMVGNREISISARRQAQGQIEAGEHCKFGSDSLVLFLEQLIQDLETTGDRAGFRRKNNPSIILEYFRSMKQILSSLAALVRPRTALYLLIGGNYFDTGQRKIFLDTPRILGEIASASGWSIRRTFRKELTSASNTSLAHRKHKGMTDEVILHLER